MYPAYEGRGLDLRKEIATQGLKIKNVIDLLVIEVAQNIKDCHEKRQSPERGVINMTLGLAEMVHYGTSHKVYCIDKESTSSLLSQKNDVKVKELSLPVPIFEVCVERGAKVTGLENSQGNEFDIPSFLVALPSENVARAVAKMHLMTLDYCFAFEKLASSGKDKDATRQREQMVGIINGSTIPSEIGLYKSFAEWLLVIYSFRGHWMYFQIPMDFNATTEEAVEHLHAEDNATRDPVDIQCQKDILRLLFNFLTCVQCDSGVLKNFKFHDRPALSPIKPSAEILEKMGFHLRCSHYRTLRDERYYSDKVKFPSYPPSNWRIIHVKDSLVKRNAEPANPLKKIMAVLDKKKASITDERHPKK